MKIGWNGKVVYDIGAHIGYHSLCFAELVKTDGKVYSFEPHPKHIERIKLNLSHNKDLMSIIQLMPFALSNREGTIELFCLNNIEKGDSSASFINDASTHYPREHYKWFKPIVVEQTTIDELIYQDICIPPDLLKIDVEGAESLVIEGAIKTIEIHRPLIVVEVHNAPNMFHLINTLQALEYNFQLLEEIDTRCFIAFIPQTH